MESSQKDTAPSEEYEGGGKGQESKRKLWVVEGWTPLILESGGGVGLRGGNRTGPQEGGCRGVVEEEGLGGK